MKYVTLAGVLAVALCAGVCEAEDNKIKTSSSSASVKKSVDSSVNHASTKGTTVTPAKRNHIDLGDDKEQPVITIGTMAPGKSYDDNTGFPSIVQSDSDMNLQ